MLAGRVAQVRAALAQGGQSSVDDVPLRVAASVMHLGLMARLLSPVLAEATLTGRAIPVVVRRLVVAAAGWQCVPDVAAGAGSTALAMMLTPSPY